MLHMQLNMQGSSRQKMYMNYNPNMYHCVVQLINYWVSEKYTLRYTGGMVPDVGQVRKQYPGSGLWGLSVKIENKIGNGQDLRLSIRIGYTYTQ